MAPYGMVATSPPLAAQARLVGAPAWEIGYNVPLIYGAAVGGFRAIVPGPGGAG